jgi:hypothetical protein
MGVRNPVTLHLLQIPYQYEFITTKEMANLQLSMQNAIQLAVEDKVRHRIYIVTTFEDCDTL